MTLELTVKMAEKALKINGQNATALASLALAQVHLGCHTVAMRAACRAVELAKAEDKEARFSLADRGVNDRLAECAVSLLLSPRCRMQRDGLEIHTKPDFDAKRQVAKLSTSGQDRYEAARSAELQAAFA